MKYLNRQKKAQQWLSFFVVFLLFSCQSNSKLISLNGYTMGTSYSIKIFNESIHSIDSNLLKLKIDSVLAEINQQMSTYIDDSEITIFNKRSDKEWQKISKEFYTVLEKSLKISEFTNGAFDITVGPLMTLWGFGNIDQGEWQPPSNLEVEVVLNYIGYKNIKITDKSLKKINSNTIIDLNAIAKGYGVDVVFEFLKRFGYNNILVEIGGEVRCSGVNQNNDIWTVGIDKPLLDILPGTDLQEIIKLTDCALATSGDYRNYFFYDNKIYSHTINPITGYPVENGIASASVIAPNCMLADALATSLMVMGAEGLSMIENLINVEALIVERKNEKEFIMKKSSGWN